MWIQKSGSLSAFFYQKTRNFALLTVKICQKPELSDPEDSDPLQLY